MNFAAVTSLVAVLITGAFAQEAAAAPENKIAAEAAATEEVPAFLMEAGDADAKGRRPCVRRYKSESSSSSSSCECCEECPKVYFEWMDFYTNGPNFDGEFGTWAYFNVTEDVGGVPETIFTADDGILTLGCNGGVLDSKVYTSWQFGLSNNTAMDHAKYWAYAKTPIPVPVHGDVVVKWDAAVQTYQTEQNPFPSALVERNDFRLANGQFMIFDPVTKLYFAFLVTNHRVYVVYSRAANPVFNPPPLPKDLNPDQWAAFTFVIPVKIRRVCDYNNMEIILHADTKEVSYHVDNQEVFLINKVGYLLDRDYMVEDAGGQELNAYPTSVYYGFGTFTGLDYYPACQRTQSCRSCQYPFVRQSLVKINNDVDFIQYNPIFGPPTPAVFYDPLGESEGNHIWGQGTVTKIRKLIAYQRLPVC